jgi:shikimate dehydrogenase
VAHSLSPALQNAALRHAELPIAYEAIDVPPHALGAAVHRLIAARAGGNVTIPHKEAMGGHCGRLDVIAQRVNAVNTFRVADDGVLEGTNTDVGGFDALARDVGALRAGARVAILGAGGSAAAVLAAVERWNGATVTLFNRTAARAAALAARFPIVETVASTADEAMKDATVVVNTTSLGLRAEDPFPVAIASLQPETVVLDLVYRPQETAWVKAARDRGHLAGDGLCMLLEQGALAFEWWFGIAAPRDVMRHALTAAPRS